MRVPNPGRYEIYWRGHPSAWAYSAWIVLGVLLAPVLIGLLILLLVYLALRGTAFVVADKKVGIERGIFVTSTRELRISDIRSIEVRRRGLGGLFGIGDIVLSSAARDDASVIFTGIANTEDVADLVRELQDGSKPIRLDDGDRDGSGMVLALMLTLIILGGIGAVMAYSHFQRADSGAVSLALSVSSSTPAARQVAAPQVVKRDVAYDTPVAMPRMARTPTPEAFLADVKYSQQVAVTKHPALATAGSPLNRTFLARMNAWKSRGDARMQRSDWPEILADDCVANP